MKRILIYFGRFHNVIGGGEYLPLLFIAELQKHCEVTLALNRQSDVNHVATMYGIPIDMSKLKIVVVKPSSNFIAQLDTILPFYRTWQLKKLAKNADICISCINMFDFGKPAHHFIYRLSVFGDNAFSDYYNHKKPLTGMALFWRRTRTFLAEKILRPLLGVRSNRKILSDTREHIYPNSNYVDNTMKNFYGSFNSTVFYPPTLADFNVMNVERDPYKIVYIGRVHPEKRIIDMVEIIEKARNATGLDLTFHIAGSIAPIPEFTQKLNHLSEEKKWIKLVGQLSGIHKEKFLLSGSYAIHAQRDETFGIAITEYLKAGLVTIVPDEGGSCEIVSNPALTYHTNDEAAQILIRLLEHDDFLNEQRQFCHKRATYFSSQAYIERQQKLLMDIVGEK